MSDLSEINILRKKLKSNINDYITDDYEGIAIHTSSIIIAVNRVAEAMFGYAEDELIGMNAWRLFNSDSFDEIMHHLVEKSEEAYQAKAIKKDKTEFIIELKGKDFEVYGEPVRAVMLRAI